MRIVDIFYSAIQGDLYFTDIKGKLNFTDINGTASDIKGSINTIGHLMLLSISDTKAPAVSGYFEVNDHIVVNAKQNYTKLYNMLSTSNIDSIAKIEGDNIRLSGHYSLIEAQGTNKAVKAGDYRTDKIGSGLEITGFYCARMFIYHGVH